MSKPMKLILKEYEKELMTQQPIQSYIFQDYTVQDISQYTQPIDPSYFPTINQDNIPELNTDDNQLPEVVVEKTLITKVGDVLHGTEMVLKHIGEEK